MEVSGGTPPSAPASITLATLGEVLAYGGAAAGLAAAAIVVEQRSSGSTAVLLATFAVSALALLGVGWLAGDNVDPRRRRIRAVLWWLSLNAAEEFIAVLFLVEAKMGVRGAFILTGVVSCLYALALWIVCKSVLQQLGLFVALIITVVAVTFPSVSAFSPGSPDVSLIAVALLVLGGVWFFLGQVGLLAPRRTARVLGSLLLLFAPYLFVANNGTSVLFLIAVIAAVLLVVGEIVHDAAVVGIAIAGIIVGAAAAVGATAGLGTSSESLAILVGGVAALAVSILLLRTGDAAAPIDEASPPPAPAQPQEPTAPPTPPPTAPMD
jgi:hypothetical protein